jgi:hypothetical protein
MAPQGNANQAQARYEGTTFGLGSEVWMAVTAKGAVNGHYLDLWTQIATPDTTGLDGYGLEITVAAGADTWDLFRFFNNTPTFPLVTQSTQELTAGDYIAIATIDDGSGNPVIEGWHWNGSAWSKKITFTDTTASKVTPAGFLGLEATKSSAWRIGIIKGGTIAAPSQTPPTVGPYGGSTVIYDPAGANTDPIADGWTTDFTGANHSSFKRLSNRIVSSNNGSLTYAQAHRAGAAYATDYEYWMEVPAKGAAATDFNPTIMIADPNLATVDFYQCSIMSAAGNDTWTLYKVLNGVASTPVAGIEREVTAGDYVGFTISDNSGSPILKGWHWSLTAPAWTQVFTYTDSSSPITTAGFFGLEMLKTSAWAVGKIYADSTAPPAPPAAVNAPNLLLVGVA